MWSLSQIYEKLEACIELVGWSLSIAYRLCADWEGLCLMFDNLGRHKISTDCKNKNFLPYRL